MKNFTFTLLVALFLTGTSGFAQHNLSGTVFNGKNKPIVGALIYLDSINSNVITNSDGYYEVVVPSEVKDINVYARKYGLLSSEFNGETKMDFVFLDGKLAAKDRLKGANVVNVGYNEVDKKYVAVGVASFNAEEKIEAFRFQTIYDLIANRLSGVRVTSDQKIIIRGVGTLISPQDPLFVVDGTIVSSIDHILPVDVKKVNVLKGSEAAIYGSRGANGVILISTKK